MYMYYSALFMHVQCTCMYVTLVYLLQIAFVLYNFMYMYM